MIEATAGEKLLLPVMFKRNGEPMIPDVGSLSFTVRDHVGQPLSGFVNQPITAGPTIFALSLEIGATANTIAPEREFERRTVFITYQVNSVTLTDRYTYRVVPLMNHSLAPKDIRSFLGVQERELDDSEVDLTVSYFKVAETLGSVDTLEEALTSGNMTEIKANDAILMVAVLDILPSLKQRIAQEETNGVKSYKRADIEGFAELEATALSRLDDAMDILLESVQTSTVYTLLVVTQDADALTG